MLYYRRWGLAEISHGKKCIGWSMGGGVPDVELPADLSPWNQDSITLLASMCPSMHKAWPRREVHELRCLEFWAELHHSGTTGGPRGWLISVSSFPRCWLTAWPTPSSLSHTLGCLSRLVRTLRLCGEVTLLDCLVTQGTHFGTGISRT